MCGDGAWCGVCHARADMSRRHGARDSAKMRRYVGPWRRTACFAPTEPFFRKELPMNRPLIGVTLDHAPGAAPPVFSRFDHYALRAHYFAAVTKAGGIPLGLGHDMGDEDAHASGPQASRDAAWATGILARLDGLVVTGGAFDIPPDAYGAEAPHPLSTAKPRRTRAERALMDAALASGKPVFGICGGMQLLAVALGGTLFQHIPDAIPDALSHEQPNPRDEPGHDVRVLPGTTLAAITGASSMAVNSSHHQAVRDPGRAIVSALAPDGVIEAIEYRAHPFAIGVQWHPEFAIDPGDAAIFAAFVTVAGNGA